MVCVMAAGSCIILHTCSGGALVACLVVEVCLARHVSCMYSHMVLGTCGEVHQCLDPDDHCMMVLLVWA